LLIKGIQKTTLIDYPNKIAATIFTADCNFRCPFCHNKDLVKNPEKLPSIPEDEIVVFLKERQNYLEGLVITGGEPTLHHDLIDFIERIKKETTLAVKLDTNGTNPILIKQLIDRKLVDYIAMDIKTSLNKYCLAAGVNVDLEKIKESTEILLKGDVDYEFRTTVVPDFFTEDDALSIAGWLKGAKLYSLQQFFPSETCLDPDFSKKEPYSLHKLGEFRGLMKNSFEKIEIKNI